MTAAWSRKAALSRLQHKGVLQPALQVEPRLQALLCDRAVQAHPRGSARDSLYNALRLQRSHLVRLGGRKPAPARPIASPSATAGPR